MLTDTDELLGGLAPNPVAPSTAQVGGSNRAAHSTRRSR